MDVPLEKKVFLVGTVELSQVLVLAEDSANIFSLAYLSTPLGSFDDDADLSISNRSWIQR